MKGWQRSARLAPYLGLLVALALTVNRGRTQPDPVPPCPASPTVAVQAPSSAEPPLAGSPQPSQAPSAPPFTAPSPTPLEPNEMPPFPGMPFVSPEPADPPVPIVRLRVRAPAQVQPDKDIEYRLTVENISRAEAHHVLVRDRLPRGTQFVRANPKPTNQKRRENGDETDLLWDFGTLKPGEQKVIVLFMNPAGTAEIKNSAYVQFEHGQTVTTKTLKPRLQVRVAAPAQAPLHDPITFRIDITNNGPAAARDVVLTDELPPGLTFIDGKPYPKPDKPLTWKLGELAPGQTRRIEYRVISTQTGTFANKAEVKAAGDLRETASAKVTVGEAKLSILKTGPERRLIQRPAPYQITVSNPGTMAATGVQVSDELPAGIELLHASAGGRGTGGQVRWTLGTLPAGERRSLQVIVRAARPGRFGNMVQARAEHDLSARAFAAETHFETASGPAVEIDPNANPLDVGQKAIYTIRLINPEKMALLLPRLIVTVPEELTVLGSRGPTTAQRDGQIVRFDALPALEAGQEVIYTVEAEARKEGEVHLRVELADDRTSAGSSRFWNEKTIIRPAPKLAPRPQSPASQVHQSHRP